jgi:hypothetical protein
MGTLYSRSIAALIAKGKYIFSLDNDDMFFDKDVFDIVYKATDYEHFDIIEFKILYVFKNNITIDIGNIYYRKSYTLSQPELGVYPISKNGTFKLNGYIIWNKCIKTDLYKKAVNILGKDRYSYFISWNEDVIIIFIIFNLAQSYKFINKHGILHIISKSSASKTQSINNKFFGDIFLLDVLFDFSKNTSDKNYAAFQASLIIKKYKSKKSIKREYISYFKFILKKLIKSQYITEKNKQNLKRYFNEF